MNAAREKATAEMAAQGLTVKSVFVPYSISRNAADGWESLNYRVTLLKNGREVMTSDYGMGIAHCPAYKNPVTFANGKRDAHATNVRVRREIEDGRACDRWGFTHKGAPILPDPCDVVYSLFMDAGTAADEGCFENWAQSLGFSTDSRKAEASYRECVDTFLKLRAALGDAGFNALREAFEDY